MRNYLIAFLTDRKDLTIKAKRVEFLNGLIVLIDDQGNTTGVFPNNSVQAIYVV